MAVATRKESISTLANTNTFSGPGEFSLLLVGGSDEATVTLSVGGSDMISLAVPTGESMCTPCLSIGSVEVTVALTGTAAKAYAIWK